MVVPPNSCIMPTRPASGTYIKSKTCWDVGCGFRFVASCSDMFPESPFIYTNLSLCAFLNGFLNSAIREFTSLLPLLDVLDCCLLSRIPTLICKIALFEIDSFGLSIGFVICAFKNLTRSPMALSF